VIDTIQSIQVSTDLKLNSIQRGRINPRGNDNDPCRAALKAMYEQYTRGDCDRLRYLKVVGYHCQPKKN